MYKNNELHVNKGADDVSDQPQIYFPVYDEGVLIGNLTMSDLVAVIYNLDKHFDDILRSEE